MADGSVIINTKLDDAQYSRGLANMQKQAGEFSRSAAQDFNSVTKSSQGLEKSLASLTKGLASAAAAYMGVSSALSSLKVGVEYNQQLESAQLGIASILASTHDLVDAQGRMLTGQEKFTAAQKLSVDMAKALDVASMQSTAEYTDLLTAFQTMLAPAAQLGLQWQDTLGVTVRMSNVLAAMNIPMESLAMETQRILTGNDLIHSQVAKRLGLTKEEIKAWGTGEKLLANLQKRFEAMGYAGEAAEKTYSAVVAYYKDSMQSLSAEVSKGAFEELKTSMLAVADAFFEIDAATKTFRVTETMQPLVDTLRSIVTAFSEAGTSGIKSLVSGLESLSQTIGENKNIIDAMGSGLRTLGDNIGVVTIALASYVAAQKSGLSAALEFQHAQAQGKAVILDGAVATRQRAEADIEAAVAARTCAEAEALLQAQLAKEAEGTVFAAGRATELAHAQNELRKANKRVTDATNTLDAAQRKATIGARAWATTMAGLKKIGAGIKGVFTNLISVINPYALAISAAVAATVHLFTRQSEAEKIAEKYSTTIAGLKGSSEEAAAALGSLAKQVERMSKEQAEFELFDAEKSLVKLRADLEKHQEEIERSFVNFFADLDGTVETPFAGVIEELLQGGITADDFRKKVFSLGSQLDETGKEKTKEIVKLSYAFEAATKWAELLTKKSKEQSEVTTKAASATDDLSEAFKKSSDIKEIKTLSDAVKYLKDYSKNTELAKKEAEANAKAQANHALAMLKVSAIAAQGTLAIAGYALAQAKATGTAEDVALAQEEYNKQLTVTGQLQALIQGFELKIPQVTFSKGSGKSAADTIDEIRKQIKELNSVDPNSFTDRLAKGLDDIAKKGKDAKLSVATISALQKEFSGALAGNYLREMNEELAKLEGRGGGVALENLARAADQYKESMLKAGHSATEAEAGMQRFYDLHKNKIDTDNLQTLVGYLKELEEMSGKYGLSIDTQNKLLEMQADIFRNLLSPELKHLADEWLKLKKELTDTSFEAGIKRSAKAFTAEWTDAGKVAEKQFDALTSALDGLGSDLVDSIFGDAEFRMDKFFKDLSKQLMKIAMNQMFANIIGGFFGAKAAHTGGVIGVADANPRRNVSPAVFANAPKFHAGGIVGLRSYEVPAILQTGEGVFTQAQMKAIGAGLSAQPEINVQVVDQRGAGAPPVEMQQSTNAQGGIDYKLIIRAEVQNMFSNGRMDSTMRNRFNVRPQVIGR